MEATPEKAISFLSCPKCGGDFRYEKEKIACRGCNFSACIRKNIIFCFEESDIPKETIERTMYGPEINELEKELSEKKSARLSFVRNLINHESDSVCLDFGCGSSRQIFDLADHFRDGIVFGSDYDFEPLAIVSDLVDRLDYKNIFLLQYQSTDLPFRDNVFNVITSHQVLEHIPNPVKSVHEIHRVLRKDGICEVDFPNGNSASEKIRNFFHRLNGTKNPHISRIGLENSRKMFNEAGFRIKRFQSVQILTGPLSYFIEGFILRYIQKKRKIWEVRKKYQSSFAFRLLQKFERNLEKKLPRMGHAFEFILTKK
jgi:ubiquinone/menaquinone biosynthesis C-methylase UbiE